MSLNKQISKKYTRAVGIIIIVVIVICVTYSYNGKCCSFSFGSGNYCSECDFFSYFKQAIIISFIVFMNNFIAIIISFIALVVSLLTFYFSRPKIKIKQRKTANKGSMGITDNGNYYIPNFILQISNPRDKGVTIDEMSIIIKDGRYILISINKTINAFSSSLFYFGPGAVWYLFESQKGEIDRLKGIYKEIGLNFNNSEKKLNNHYPFPSGLVIPKEDYEINKNNENKLTINIETAFKTFKVPLLLKYFKNN